MWNVLPAAGVNVPKLISDTLSVPPSVSWFVTWMASNCEPAVVPPSSMLSVAVGVRVALPPNVTLAGPLPGE